MQFKGIKIGFRLIFSKTREMEPSPLQGSKSQLSKSESHFLLHKTSVKSKERQMGNIFGGVVNFRERIRKLGQIPK